jgi:hypothetical protein
VRQAMLYAASTPRFWSPEMHESFTSAFHALVSTENEEKIAEKPEEAAGLYCLAPRGETPKDKEKEPGKKKLADYIDLRFEGYPNTTLKEVLPKWLSNAMLKVGFEGLLNTAWNDVLDEPKIRVKLVKKDKAEEPPKPKDPLIQQLTLSQSSSAEEPPKPKKPPKTASYHTDLCVQLYSKNDTPFLQPIKIPAGFTSKLSEPVSRLLPRVDKIEKGTAWELEGPDAGCELAKKAGSVPQNEAVPEYKENLLLENLSPSTVVVLPFTLFAFLVLGAFIGTFFNDERQQAHLDRLWKAVTAPFTSRRRVLQDVLFILVVLPLLFTLERLEYTKEVRQFFSHVPVQAWLIPLALLLGFVLVMVVERLWRVLVRR